VEITDKEYNKLIKTIEMLKDRVERLENELRKYKNENTPSSMTPPFLKALEKQIDREIKNAEEKKMTNNLNTMREIRDQNQIRLAYIKLRSVQTVEVL
jgi:hypothetical protein